MTLAAIFLFMLSACFRNTALCGRHISKEKIAVAKNYSSRKGEGEKKKKNST